MKTGISRGMHGYEEIDTQDQVTVRSEVARLTRLYDKAVRTNTANNPDIYQGNTPQASQDVKLRQSVAIPSPAVAIIPPQGGDDAVSIAPVATPVDPDASPATLVVLKKDTDDDKKKVKKDDGKASDSKTTDSPGAASSSDTKTLLDSKMPEAEQVGDTLDKDDKGKASAKEGS
jgi:hypothetical protein